MNTFKVTNNNLDTVSLLIKDGYLTKDYSWNDSYITLRTLGREEREEISTKYKMIDRSYNFMMILEILSFSLCRVGGIRITDRSRVFNLLSKFQSTVIIDMYNNYIELNNSIEKNIIKYIEIWSETSESKSFWRLFRRTMLTNKFMREMNEYQGYWVYLNEAYDIMEKEKKEWSRVEYMTNSICAFTNPAGWKKSKSKMNVSEIVSKDFDEDIEYRRLVLEQLEIEGEAIYEEKEREELNENGCVSADSDLFNSLKKKHGESQAEFNNRINDALKEHISGKVVDGHDKIIKEHEKKELKEYLQQERAKREVAKELSSRRRVDTEEDLNKIDDGIFREEESMVGDEEVLEKMRTHREEGEWAFNGIDYAYVMNEKSFMGLRKDEKREVFNEVMNAKLDIEAAIAFFMKEQYKPVAKPIEKEVVEPLKEGLIEEDVKVMDVKNMAAKAALMDVNLKNRDLVKEKKENTVKVKQRIEGKLDRRNAALGILPEDDEADLMVL